MSWLFTGVLGACGAASGASLSFPADVVGPYSVQVTSLRDARQLGTIRQQFDFSCGSAALATLLTHHYGYSVTEQTVFRVMYLRGDQAKIRREGFSLLDMKHFLAANGFDSDGFEAPLDALVKAGVPAIALISEAGYHHFVVIKGLMGERVLIGDPARGTRTLSRSDFEAVWQNGILFVIKNQLADARFNRATDWQAAPQAPIDASLHVMPHAVPAMRAVSDF